MKEIALKKQAELEDIYARAHVEIDTMAARENIVSLIESGNFEPSELLNDLDNQISKAKEEALSRKEILEKVEKWMSACEEESWLEDYNRVTISFMFKVLILMGCRSCICTGGHEQSTCSDTDSCYCQKNIAFLADLETGFTDRHLV